MTFSQPRTDEFRRTLWTWLGGLLTVLVSFSAAASDATELAQNIDRHIEFRLETEGLKPASLADDAEFLRRVYLDLHGVIPTAEQATRFLAIPDEQKRTKLIDELLSRPRFGQHFGNLWRARLLSPLAAEDRQRRERFEGWLAQRFNDNDRWDHIVRDLVTATGKLEDNPAATYLIEGRNPLGVTDLTDLTSHYFLGIRLNCAQCHDHPFTEWKRQDYWGMAAFFTQIQTPGRAKQVYMNGVQDNAKLTLATLPMSDMLDGFLNRPPTFLGGKPLASASGLTYREALANWMTAAENPYFARAAVNRLSWQFFGRGIVNPVDDMHSGNSASHPELLDLLTQRFIESGFNVQDFCRAILQSRAYQRTSRSGDRSEDEAKWFARMSIKVLSAEQLYDSLVVVLGSPAKAPGIDARLGTRYEFTQFFAGDNNTDPTRYERGIPHLLRLMNSPQFAGRNMQSLVARAADARQVEDRIDQLFLTILSRRPAVEERELAARHLQAAPASETGYRELAWTLLMSSEFSLNH